MQGAKSFWPAVAVACLAFLSAGCGIGGRYRAVAEWELSQDFAFVTPVALWAEGDILYVAGSQRYVVEFTGKGDIRRQWGYEYLVHPADIALDRQGNTYVSDRTRRQVFKFRRDGKLLGRLGAPGKGPGFFGSPNSLAVMPDGSLLVLDQRWRTLTRFDVDGRLLDYKEDFDAWSIATDKKGNMYAITFKRDQVKKFGPEGRLLATWGGKGTQPGKFGTANDIATDSAGRVYVLETGNRRVQVFTAQGKPVGLFGAAVLPGRDFQPVCVAVDKAGYIYVANAPDGHILKIAPPGL